MVKIVATKEEFDEAIKSEKLVIVDFFATWCGPCKNIAPFFEELASKYPDVLFIKVDVDENEATAQAADISAMPTFQAYKDGKMLGQVRGAGKEPLEALVTKNI